MYVYNTNLYLSLNNLRDNFIKGMQILLFFNKICFHKIAVAKYLF